jgi:hypothetical protein
MRGSKRWRVSRVSARGTIWTQLTLSTSAWSAWSRDAGRRQIGGQELRPGPQESATPATNEGAPHRFRWRGGRWRDGGPPGHLGPARGGLEQRRRAAAMAATSGACGEETEKGERARGRGEKEGGDFVAPSGVSRGSPRWPERRARGGNAGLLGASTHLLLEEDNTQLQIAPLTLGFSLERTKQHIVLYNFML